MTTEAVKIFVTPLYSETKRFTAIRNLAGNINSQTKSDDDITEIASRKDRRVFFLTGKSDWSDDDPNTPLIIDASNCLTAVEILRSFGTVENQNIANSLVEKANEIIQELNLNSVLQVIPDVEKTLGFNDKNKGTFN